MDKYRSQARRIAQVLRKDPSAWCQGWFGKTRSGDACGIRSKQCVSRCAVGWIFYVAGEKDETLLNKADSRTKRGLASWNDARNRRVADVIEFFDDIAVNG